MASVANIVTNARTMLRDFARPFHAVITGDGVQSSFSLPKQLIVASSLSVVRQAATPASFVAGTDYTLDARSGYVTFAVTPTAYVNYAFDGMAYDWFFDADLTYFAGNIVGEHSHNRSDFNLDALDNNDPETTAITLGTIVEGLWSLLAEVARDIDVHAPEGVSIPASERYQQILSLLQYYQAQYNSMAENLGVGLDRIEMLFQRRVSTYTGRLVPLYIPREIGDIDPPERVYVPIDNGQI